MPFDAPFMLGPFAVDAAGRLEPGEPDGSPAFLIRWRGRVIRAKLSRARPDKGSLRLQTTLGRVPSSAGHPVAGLRPQIFALLHQLPQALPNCWTVCLLPDHRIQLMADAQIGLPITATGLLVELTLFLLELAPYLDLADDAGIAAPSDTRSDMRT